MLKLTQEQIQKKIDYINNYVGAKNTADGSKFDANANVTSKNIATMSAEINKDINIQINRELLKQRISALFDESLGDEYVRQLESHEIYTNDETNLAPYCVSVSLYPLLLNGLKDLGGESKAPQHIDSFCGTFVNAIFAISAQFSGAVAAVEFLMYFDYFARKEYGDNYLETHTHQIANHLQHVIYALNQPAAARGYQAVFFNISIYDEHYFDGLFGDFYFPCGDRPKWDTVKQLQEFFMTWFNKEREKALLTFPVITAAMLTADGKVKDREFGEMCAKQLSEGNSFFVYQSDSADSLASCCRLRNEISDNTFSYSLGAGGVSTGSINVITINMNRLVQDGRDLAKEIEKIQKYQVAYRTLMDDYKNAGMLSVYDAGFISLDKQYLTIGINGLVEAAEYMGIDISVNEDYAKFVEDNLKVIFNLNKEAKKKYGYMFNTEFVPAENLGVKNAKWDKEDGYVVPRDCYNSYFYVVEDDEINALDKFALHGERFVKWLDGGSALHLNLEDYPNKEGFVKLLDVAAKQGCNYFCTNVIVTLCNNCSKVTKQSVDKCPHCGSMDVVGATRVIGYLKPVSSWSSQRQKEHSKRFYHKK